MDHKDGPPSEKLLTGNYNQTYIIQCRSPKETKIEGNEVLFKCGNWCYKGLVQFNDLGFNLEEVPVIIPTLQRQQGSLRYFSTAKSIPEESEFHGPLRYMEDAVEFLATELSSDHIERELRKMANIFPWIEEDNELSYFELTIGNLPDYMKGIEMIASKTYSRGLVIISIYYDRCIYCVIQSGEGDQPLLDVRFPNVSKHGQGLLLSTYNEEYYGWKKLTLWHIIDSGGGASSSMVMSKKDIPKLKTINVSTANYEQTYAILKSTMDPKSPLLSVYHDALFRFGSWCYSGRVQLTPTLTLQDVPYVIPALRMQQSRLDFYCDVNNFPINSPYAGALEYVNKVLPLIELHVAQSETSLKSLVDRLSNMGLGESVSKWLEGDPANSFFEFKLAPTTEMEESMRNVEIIVSKCYHASGIITIMIIFEFTVYISIAETNGENPLLDSKFPDVSGKGRGYQIESYNNGTDDWPELRKVSVWQTVGALEQEFREKAAQFAQSKQSFDDVPSEKEEVDDIETARPQEKVQPTQTHTHSESKSFKLEADRPSGHTSPTPEAAKSVASTISIDDFKSDSKAPDSSIAASASSPNSSTSPMRMRQALPHHLPKLDALSHKLDDIRKNNGDGGLKAPWDSKGRPLGAVSALKNFIGGDCLKPSILVIGGSGRVGGSAVKAFYQQYHENFLISVGGRSYDNWKSYCDLKRLKLNDYGWRNVDITSKESIQSPIRDFDLIINTAGPFQGLRDPILLRESLRLGKRYIDVCDDIELSRIATSKEFQLIAKEGNGKAVISTGIWPGVSSILAKEVSDQLKSQNEKIDRLEFSFFTAGSGGAGPTILTATFLILGENVLTYVNGNPVYIKSGSESKIIDFGKGIGEREVIAMNLIECESSFKSGLAPTVNTKFGTAPPVWNTLFKLMTQLIPQRILQDREQMARFAVFSVPLVRLVDSLVGATNGIRVDFFCQSGKKQTAILNHQNLEDCVGEAIASFATEILQSNEITPGVFFPEELPKRSRDRILENSIKSSIFHSWDYKWL
eukprot:gene12900-14135_t